MKQKLDKWEGWLRIIYDDMVHQAGSRTVFRETAEIIRANPALPKESAFLTFLEQWYVDSIVMGLRRQLKVHSDTVSLAGLLDDIATNDTLLSRQHFVALYPTSEQPRAHKAFDRHAGAGAEHIHAVSVRADIDKLKSLAQRCEEYADRIVAHRDKRGVPDPPTYQELNEAIDFMEGLLKKYYLLLCGDSLARVSPTFLTPWRRIFETAWLPSEGPANRRIHPPPTSGRG